MNIKEAIKELNKQKSCELMYAEIIEYITSFKSGEIEVFDVDSLSLMSEEIKSLLLYLETKRKHCYDTVKSIENFTVEIKNGSQSKGTTRKRQRKSSKTK